MYSEYRYRLVPPFISKFKKSRKGNQSQDLRIISWYLGWRERLFMLRWRLESSIVYFVSRKSQLPKFLPGDNQMTTGNGLTPPGTNTITTFHKDITHINQL